MATVLAIAASNAIVSALLAVLALAMTRWWRSPPLAHALWLLVLVKLVTPPLVAVSPPDDWLTKPTPPIEQSPNTSQRGATERPPIALQEARDLGADAITPAGTTDVRIADSSTRPAPRYELSADRGNTGGLSNEPPLKHEDAPSWLTQWVTMFVMLWLVGSIGYAAILLLRCVTFRRLLVAADLPDRETAESAARLAARLGLKHCPRIRVTNVTVPPLVWSLSFRSLVLLPARLLAELTTAQRDSLIAHELAHVRRHDHLVRWLEVLALVTFWWDPVAWFARRKLREAEEECCDAWVVWALPAERRSYGQAMLAAIEFLTDGPKLPVLAGSTFSGSSCKRRIEMIMKRNANPRISWTAVVVVVLLSMVALPIVAQTNDAQNAEPGASRADANATEDATTPLPPPGTASAGTPPNAGNSPARSGAANPLNRSDDEATRPSSAEGVSAPHTSDFDHLVNLFAGEAQNPGADGETETKLNTREALLLRIIQLEQLLQLSNTVPATSSSAARRLPTNALPRFDVSPDEREQQLQQKLLELDIQAAEAEVAKAKLALEKSLEANRKQPHVISDIDIARQNFELRAAEVQLRRAQTILQLFQRRAERSYEKQTSSLPKSSSSSNFSSHTQHELQANHRDKLARLKAQNQQTAAEIERLERLLKESELHRRTASDRLLKDQDTVADPDRRASGNRE